MSTTPAPIPDYVSEAHAAAIYAESAYKRAIDARKSPTILSGLSRTLHQAADAFDAALTRWDNS